MAGLIAANMLRRHTPVVYEAQDALPNNHEALLRFRTDAVSRATAIPFKKVTVDKSIFYLGRHFSHPTIAFNNMYSFKVMGAYGARSISNLRSAERFIAPPDFISQMARSCKIEYRAPLTRREFDHHEVRDGGAFISTIPMPVMMRIARVSAAMPSFQYRGIWSASVDLEGVELYQTIYYPGNEWYYRASITGSKLIVEYSKEPKGEKLQQNFNTVLDSFGINLAKFSLPFLKFHEYGKLRPLSDESARRHFITEMSDKYRVYSLGRFATWRQILLDDIVSDVHRIEGWIEAPDTYRRRLEN